MNKLKTVTYMSIRTYGKRVKAGIRSKVFLQESVNNEVDIEHFDEDDLDQFEAEFMHADEFHRHHEREEQHKKDQLKNQITTSKYFKKDKDPNFLTFVEKDQIRTLHEKDPKEWTVERLSESFPALPETIRKILKAKWIPNSPEKIVKYDERVIQNWKLYSKGKLPLEPDLSKHLEKFKDRKITVSDRHRIAEKLILPKPELPKPRSKFFSNIIQSYLDETKCNGNDQKVLTDIKTSNTNKENISDENSINVVTVSQINKSLHVNNQCSIVSTSKLSHSKKNIKKKQQTFVEFAKQELPKIYEESPEEGITLLATYKKYLESENSKNQLSNPPNAKEQTVNSNDIQKLKEENTSVMHKNNDATLQVSAIKNDDDSYLDTFVKSWNKKTFDTEDYTKSIKIPKKLYKKGQTYRIKDCYYDDNGEFLYRVPGVWG